MPARSVVLRVFAAVAVSAACLGIGSTAAHAVNLSASATLQCEQIPGSQYKTAVWHVHLENNEPGPNGHLFLVDSTDAFNNYAANYYLQPGETKDVTSQGIDGLGASLIVSSDLAVLLQTGTSTVCNPPTVD